MDRHTYIYGLVDPRNGKTRYIGKSDRPASRLSAHLSDKSPGHKRNWIDLLKRIGLKPILAYLCKVPETRWRRMERFQIALFQSRGMADLNQTSGGDSGYKHSEETKVKMREAVR